MLCNSHRYGPRRSSPAARLILRNALAHHDQGCTSGPPPRTINSHPRTGSIIHGDLLARCKPSLDIPSRHAIFTSPIRHAGDILLFAIQLRSCQGAAPQHRSIAACVLSIPRMRWQQPSPQIGERGAPTPFFLRQSCSGPSWRSPRQPRQASEVIVLLTQLPSSLYFAGPPNQNRAGVKFSRETHLGSRFIFFGATGPVWREHGGFFDDFYFSFSSLFDRTVSVEFGSFAFLDTFASMSGRDGWERRYQDRDGQNWDTRSLFFCNGFLVLPGTAKEEEGFRPVTYCTV